MHDGAERRGVWDHWDPVVFGWTVGITALLIAGGSLYKIAILRAGGGEAIASMFGGTFIHPGTANEDERRLLNVTEEMALAAGIAVPRVFLIDSGSINAMAAGHSINGAVIGVTRGCLTRLTRQELQGVVAHEFSHIINGDMAGNLRLVGLLHGILLLAIVGRILVRAAGRAGGGKGSGQARLAFLAVGGGMVVIGYSGVFFGRLIKAAVSRQREFLADATAVQYTRDTEGIYGALLKISGARDGGRVDEPVVEELSHLFFANALSGEGGGIFSTHPPVRDRLERIMPGGFDHSRAAGGGGEGSGDYLPGLEVSRMAVGEDEIGGRGGRSGVGNEDMLAGLGVGEMSGGGVAGAGVWMAGLHPLVEDALKTPRASCGLLLSLLISRVPAGDRPEFERRGGLLPEDIREVSARLQPVIDAAPLGDILPIVDLCLSALRDSTPHDLRSVRDHLNALVGAGDESNDFFGYMVTSFIRARLEVALQDSPAVIVPGALRHLPDIRVVMAFLARAGHRGDRDGAELSYRRAMETFALEIPAATFAGVVWPTAESEISPEFARFDQSLFALRKTSPRVRRAVMEAAVAGIFSDNEAGTSEHELFRALAGVLDCPVPPVLGAWVKTVVPSQPGANPSLV